MKREYSQDFSGPSITQQHFKESCDATNIVNRFTNTGLDPYADRKAQERFGHATSQTFQEAMFTVAEINSRFQALPSKNTRKL